MGQNLTNFDACLKDVYGPRIIEQLNIVNVLGDWIDENDSEQWTGRQIIYPIHVTRSQGVGASAETYKLPKAGNQGYADVKIPERKNYGRIELTIDVIKSSESNKGAFARAMESEMTGIVRDLANDRERQFFGNGKGVLALCSTAANNTVTIAVDCPFGVASPTTNGTRFLQPNMTCVSIDPTTDTTIEDTFTISTIDSADQITITPASTLSNNARIVRWNADNTAGDQSAINIEVTGLLGLIDDGTYVNTLHNINRTTYPIFKSKVIGSVGALSLDVIQRGADATDELGGGNFGQNGVMFCHHSLRREYLKLLQADRRYQGADLRAPDGGTKQAALKRGGQITYGDRPMIVAKHAPYGMLFGTLKGSIVRYVHVKGEWADEDGAILRNVAGYDKWEAHYRIFDELHTDRPNDGFRLDGVTVTVGTPNHVY